MVTFNFKLREMGSVRFPLSRPDELDIVLQQYAAAEGVNLGGYIAIRRSKVIGAKTLIENGDVVDILPAISGG